MKIYRVNNEREAEILEVTAESELGFHVRITCPQNGLVKEYLDFISRNLFEALLDSGYLQEQSEAS